MAPLPRRSRVQSTDEAIQARPLPHRLEAIPARAHLCWFGPNLPWVHSLAVTSAAIRGGFDEVILHHSDELPRDTVQELERADNVRLRRLDTDALMEAAGGPRLVDTCRALTTPVARSNLVRAALCAAEGGVYLDMDTVTVAPFDALRGRCVAFVGGEHIVFPHRVRRSLDPRVHARAYALTALRDLLRRVPRGYRGFSKIAHLYSLEVNGAVMGSVPGHPFPLGYLAAMVDVPESRRGRPHALGTHLLQDVTDAYAGGDLLVTEAEVCYPFSPEISEHLFRMYPDVNPSDVIGPQTAVVHWYASVRTRKLVPLIDRAYVRTHRNTQLFSAIADAVLVSAGR